jgi:hypothetical protein
MDAIGMLGIPLVPVARFPDLSPAVLLPSQAAADPAIGEHIDRAVRRGQHLVFTSGFLATAAEGGRFARIAGLDNPVIARPHVADRLRVPEGSTSISPALRLHADLSPGTATTLLAAKVDGHLVPFLTEQSVGAGRVFVLNTHTYSQSDFDAVGEVLLPPTPLGLLEIPAVWAEELRRVLGGHSGLRLRGPTRVTLQPLDGAGWLIQNYNSADLTLDLEFADSAATVQELISGQTWAPENRRLVRSLPARSRWWIRTP